MNFRSSFYISLLFAVLVPSVTVKAEDAPLLARLHAAEQAQSLDQPGMKPWHLVLSVRLLDSKGKQTDGTVEEWWDAPDTYRVVYTLGGAHAVELRNPAGLFRSPTAPSYFARRVLQQVVHPVQSFGGFAGLRPELKRQKTFNLDLDCILLDPRHKGQPDPSVGEAPTYCLGRNTTNLVVSYENAQTNAFVAVTGFQGHTAPLDLTISIGNAEIASEHLERLELTPQVAVNYTDTAGLTRVTEEPAHIGTGLIRISKSIEPEFPAVATASHMSGVVYVDTVISGEGTVREAQPIWSTSPIFEKPAVDDVRLQSYQPFIIGGKPVEAETIVVVSFSVRPPPAY